MHLGWFKLRIS